MGGATVNDQKANYDAKVASLESDPGIHLTIRESADLNAISLPNAAMTVRYAQAAVLVPTYMCDWLGVRRSPDAADFQPLVETVMTNVTMRDL